jgi:hypothetical protein
MKFNPILRIAKIQDPEVTLRQIDSLRSKLEGKRTPEDRYYSLKFNEFGVMKSLFGVYFQAILEDLVLPPTLRKRAEVASRQAFKKSRPPQLPPQNFSNHLEVSELKFAESMAEFDKLLALAKECRAKGKPHSEESNTKMKAGPFTLLNVGGFSLEVMQRVQATVEKASSLITASGFGKCLYGEIQVTNQIHSKKNVAAFYLPASDEVLFRGDRFTHVALHTLIHELGHRYEKKFVKRVDVERLYTLVSGQDRREERKLPLPAKGA